MQQQKVDTQAGPSEEFSPTHQTSVRSVIIKGIEFLQSQDVTSYQMLQQQFQNIFLPLCTSSHQQISELLIPKDLKNSRPVDLAHILTPQQGQKFCDEIFDLCIPELNKSINNIVAVKNGGQLSADFKVGWLSKIILKTLYRAIETDDLVNRTIMTANLVWKDDDKRQVNKHLKMA